MTNPKLVHARAQPRPVKDLAKLLPPPSEADRDGCPEVVDNLDEEVHAELEKSGRKGAESRTIQRFSL